MQTVLGESPVDGKYGHNTEQNVFDFVAGTRMDELNNQLGTQIDFGLVAGEEGFRLDGYIPTRSYDKTTKTWTYPDNSGVTIGMGFDLGQIDKATLMMNYVDQNGFSDDLTNKLLPFVGLTKKSAGLQLDNLGAPLLSAEETSQVTYAVGSKYATDIVTKFNDARAEGVPQFSDLTPAQQTVLYSRYYQQPGITYNPRYAPLWNAATSGDWNKVVQVLQNYPLKSVQTRTTQEAAWLINSSSPH